MQQTRTRTDQAVQRQGLSENEDENHAYKQLGLLGIGTHACVPNNANGHASSQGSQAASQAGGKVGVAVKEVVRLICGLVDYGGGGGERVRGS